MTTAVVDLLTDGDLEFLGRVPTASNLTLVCRASTEETSLLCVYKPVRGEAPLWDFPDGTLAGREVATFLISDALGWDVVPETVLRIEGPDDAALGTGMLQRWVQGPGSRLSVGPDPDDEEDADRVDADPADDGAEPAPVDLFPVDGVPDGYRPVLRGYDELNRLVVLAHAPSDELHRLAVFDAVVNNADRKAGHILADDDGRLYGIDHGICLHRDDKLRTVLWGWAGEPVPDGLAADLRRLAARLADAEDSLTVRLNALITADEVAALAERAAELGDGGAMPLPPGERAIPWPPF